MKYKKVLAILMTAVLTAGAVSPVQAAIPGVSAWTAEAEAEVAEGIVADDPSSALYYATVTAGDWEEPASDSVDGDPADGEKSAGDATGADDAGADSSGGAADGETAGQDSAGTNSDTAGGDVAGADTEGSAPGEGTPDVTDEFEATAAFVLAMPESMTDRGVPVLSITLNGTTLRDIHQGDKETKYPGNRLQFFEGGESILEDPDVEIKGRGNSTWRGPKKPYQIKFGKKTDLFGMGATKKWVLLANINDSSQLRNEVALSLAARIELNYSFSGKFVDLYVDDEYIGLYYLTHKVELDDNVVNLEKDDAILVENDTIHEDPEAKYVTAIEGQYLYLKETNDSALEMSALESFGKAYDRFEADCYVGEWDAVSQEIDVVSFAKYYLLSEFTANPDANHSSFYLYRDGEDDVIHCGPAWDFDLAFGRNGEGTNYYDPHRIWCYNDTYNAPERTSRIFTKLMDMPDFRRTCEQVYSTIVSGAIASEIVTVEARGDAIRTAAVADNDYWGKKDFDTAVSDLKQWLTERKEFMDFYFGGSRVDSDYTDCVICNDDGMICVSDPGARLDFSDELPIDTRLFSVSAGGNGFYTFTSLHNGKVLYDNNRVKNSDAALRQYKAADVPEDGRQWLMIDNGDRTVTLLSKNSSLAITLVDGELRTQPWTGGPNQRFRVVQVDDQDAKLTAFLERLYQGCLGRAADEGGLKNWKEALYKGYKGTDVTLGFLGSREFLGMNLSDADFIKALYRTVFGREADEGGLSAWLNVLKSGATRGKVQEGFLNSHEMQYLCEAMGVSAGKYFSDDICDMYFGVTSFVSRLYENCLGRNFDDAGLKAWVTALVNGDITGTEAAAGFFNSREMEARGLDDEAFLVTAYATMLDREPDEGGMAAWKKALEEGYTRDQIIRNFAGSREFGAICDKYEIIR